MTSLTARTAAEKMDRQYRVQRHIYDATRTHYLFWRQRLIADLRPPAGGSVVEVACGTGWNIIRAADLYPHAQLYGLDISSEMLATARAKVAAKRLSHRIQLAHGDATAFDLKALFGQPLADRIFISYAVSMIPGWPAVIERAVQSLSPTGALHIVDFGTMDRMAPAAKWALRRWLAHYNVTPRDDLEPIAREMAGRHNLALSFEETPRGYSAYAVLRKRQ